MCIYRLLKMGERLLIRLLKSFTRQQRRGNFEFIQSGGGGVGGVEGFLFLGT